MKKTTLAIAVPALLAAGAASASINLYDANGVTVDMSGAAEIQYIQKYNPRATNAAGDDAHLRIDDGDLLITSSMEVTQNLNAIAGIGFKFESGTGDTGDAVSDELWVGFDSDFGRLTFGRQLLIVDDAGNAHDYELGTEQVDFVEYDTDQVIKWLFDNGTFYAGFDYSLDNDTTATDGRSIVDARIGARFEGLDARVYLYDAENVSAGGFSTVTQDLTGYNLELDYAIGAFDVATSYGQIEYSESTNTTNKLDVDFFQISGGFQADEKTYFAVGYDFQDASRAGTVASFEVEESSSLYANVTYKLHSNAKVYAEVGTADVKVNGVDQDTDTGYVLGMEVKF